jgi:hypothetical protein
MLFAAAVVGAVVYAWQRLAPRRASRRRAVPGPWRELAREDERLAQALELRGRLDALARREHSLVDDGLVGEVDEVIASLVVLATLRLELDRHLAGLDPAEAARDAAALGPGRAARLQASYDSLVARRDRLTGEESEIVTGLREIYLDVLEGVTGSGAVLRRTRLRSMSWEG